VLTDSKALSVDIVKIDIEGQECNVMKQGSSLFSKFQPRFVQFEGKDATTSRCMSSLLRSHHYQIGVKQGHDGNTVGKLMKRPSHTKSEDNHCIPPDSELLKTEVKDASGAVKFHMAVYKGDFISSEIIDKQYWEIREPQDLADLGDGKIPETGTFLDIGGNIGYYSLLFASRGYDVITVEPLPRNIAAINASRCLNPELSARMQLFPVALSNPSDPLIGKQPCRVQGDSWESNWDNGRLQCGPGMRCNPDVLRPPCVDVTPTTLDVVLTDSKALSVDIVKIDIEGQECNVMKQGSSLFSKFQPRFVQFEEKDATTSRCMSSLLRSHHYPCILISILRTLATVTSI
jgi:FkbM family methyltransferase